MKLYSDGEGLGGSDSVEADGEDGFTIQCGVEGDVEPPEIALYAGAQRVMGAEEDECSKDD